MLDPYFILGVGLDATDDDVEAAYRALLLQAPPDRAPDRFALLRAAYEALRTPRGRVESLLFHFDETGRALTDLETWLGASARRPPSREGLRDLALESLE